MRARVNETIIAHSFQAHQNIARSLEFSPHVDNLLMSGDMDEVAFWDLRNLSKRLFTLRGNKIRDVEFYKAKGGYLITSRENTVDLIDLGSYKPEDTDEHNGVVQLSFNGTSLIASRDGTSNGVQFWEIASGIFEQ